MFKTFYGFNCVRAVMKIIDDYIPADRYKITHCIATDMDDGRVVVTATYQERIN